VPDHAGLVAASTAFCDDARVIWHDEATHWVHHEEPAAVNEALTAFLAD